METTTEKPFWLSATKLVLLGLIISIIVLNFMQIEVGEPLKSVALMVVSFYFGQKVNSNT